VAGSTRGQFEPIGLVSLQYLTIIRKAGLTKPCKNVTSRLATLWRLWNRLNGMSGCFASRFSLYTKNTDMTQPKIMRQITVGEFHGNAAPPKSRPRSSIKVNPRIERLPNQSIALTPSMTWVRGLCTSRNNSSSINAVPEMGRLIQNIQRQEANSDNTPPRIGPAPPARAHINSNKPR